MSFQGPWEPLKASGQTMRQRHIHMSLSCCMEKRLGKKQEQQLGGFLQCRGCGPLQEGKLETCFD